MKMADANPAHIQHYRIVAKANFLAVFGRPLPKGLPIKLDEVYEIPRELS